jgi:hypothetical protein
MMSNAREEVDKHVRNLIQYWEPEVQKLISQKQKEGAIYLVISHLIYQYYKEKGIETSSIKKLDETCESIVRLEDFWKYAILNYKVDINQEKNSYDIRKVSDKELEVFKKYFDGEYGPAEFRKQLGQTRYPSLAEKEAGMISETAKQLENMENNSSPMRPEVNARINRHMKGYDDAPGFYKLERLFVCEAGHRNGWDDAEIEKILNNRVEKSFHDGEITMDEYVKIKEVVKRETEKKLQC